MSHHHHAHAPELKSVETKMEHELDKHQYNSVFKDLVERQKHDPKHFQKDLEQINKDLHKDGYLPGLEIVQVKPGEFDLKANGSAPPPEAPTHYNPPSGGYDNSGGNRGGGGTGGGGSRGFGGDTGGNGSGNGTSDGGSSNLPASGPGAFNNYDGSSNLTPSEASIAEKAAADIGQSLWTDWLPDGNEGCAASVSKILNETGAAHMTPKDASCSTMQTDLMGQGWTVTDKPQPGDVVIGYGGLSSAHTGIVGKNGTVMDNHSSSGKWSQDSLSYFSNWNKVVFLKPPAAKH